MDRETRDKQKDEQARDSQRDNERERETDRQTDRQIERERSEIFELRMKLRTNNISSFEFFSTRAATSKRFQKLNKLWLTTKARSRSYKTFFPDKFLTNDCSENVSVKLVFSSIHPTVWQGILKGEVSLYS